MCLMVGQICIELNRRKGKHYGSIAMKYVTYIKNFPTLSSFLMGIQYQLNIALRKCEVNEIQAKSSIFTEIQFK